MADHRFKFRFSCEYESTENDIKKLQYDHLTEDGWQRYDPEYYQGGFLVLLYAIVNCQHMYFRMKAAERGLILEKADGWLEAESSEDWQLTKLHIHIDGSLAAGNPSEDDREYIVNRMQHCPVSVNMKAIPDLQTSIEFQ